MSEKIYVSDWVGWNDDYEVNNYIDYYERMKIVADALKENGYHFSGEVHQNYKHGVPLLNDGTVLYFTFREWGRIMAMAYPDEIDNSDGMGYCAWAWNSDWQIDEEKLPKGKE